MLVSIPHVDGEIASVLAAYLLDPSLIGPILRDNEDLPVLARAFGALPVYADIGGALLIRPSGEVLFVHSNQAWDAAAEVEVTKAEELICQALR